MTILGTTPFDQLYSSKGSRNGGGFSTPFLGLLENSASHWYQVVPGNIWSILVDLQLHYHHHHHHTTRPRLHLSRSPNQHFRSFSGRTRSQLVLFDRVSELVITVVLPLESISMLSIIFLLALSHSRGDNSSASFHRSHEASLLALLYLDLLAIFVVFHSTFKRLLLYYKTLPLICLAWCLHSREVLGAAVRQMRAAEYLFFFRSRNDQARVDGGGGREAEQLNAAYRHYLVNTISGENSRAMSPGSQRLSAAIGTIWVNVFMREHCRLLVDLVHLNRHLVSPLLFWFYSPVLVSSVYILCLLYFMPLAILLKLYFSCLFIACLITFALLGFLSLSALPRADALSGKQC